MLYLQVCTDCEKSKERRETVFQRIKTNQIKDKRVLLGIDVQNLLTEKFKSPCNLVDFVRQSSREIITTAKSNDPK